MNRKDLIGKMMANPAENWDVVVIGGGATGLGTALDASLRGFKTILFEQADFAKSTSGKSTKLVHGGVRYLAKGDIGLVMEALKERGLLLNNAPHLTRNQEFIVPVYTWMDVVKYTIGLTLYDLLAGNRSLGKSRYIKKSTVLNRIPTINPKGLKGGIAYHDGQFDDARLAIDMVKKIIENGGVPLNYFKVKGLKKNSEGRIYGVEVQDVDSGIAHTIYSKVVINATGVFADEIHWLDDPSAKPTLRPSQGIHLVLDHSFLSGSSAIMIPKTDDGRVLFAIPWHDRVVLGTTDTPVKSVVLEPKANDSEIQFVLETARHYLSKKPEKSDVLSVYTGLRPLAFMENSTTSTKEISRRHKISISKSGLVSIVGGKWTTYRRMAQDVLNTAIRCGELPEIPCSTENFRFCKGIYEHLIDSRLLIYGDDAMSVNDMILNDAQLEKKLHPALPYTFAEVLFAIKNEFCLELEDVLSRRTRALLLNAKASIEIAPVVASMMAREFGNDSQWELEQIKKYERLVSKYMIH